MENNSLLKQLGFRDRSLYESVDKDRIAAFNEHPCCVTLSHIRKRYQTPEIVRRAIEQDDGTNTILLFVSRRLMTYDLCLEAVKKNPHNLRYVPPRLLDAQLCAAAVATDGSLLFLVHDEYRTPAICELAVCHDSSLTSGFCALRNVPTAIIASDQGRSLCEKAVKHNPLSLRYVPENYVTAEMALEAVRNSSPGSMHEPDLRHNQPWFKSACDWPIKYVPERYMTPELVQISFNISPCCIDSVLEEYLTEELCMLSVRNDGKSIRFIPSELVNKELVEAALEQSPRAIEFVPPRFQTKNRCLKMLALDPAIRLWTLPDSIQATYEKALEKDEAVAQEPMTESTELVILSAKPVKLPVPTDDVSDTSLARRLEPYHELADVSLPNTDFVSYITDIHLEHQLDLDGKSLADARKMIAERVEELVESVPLERRKWLLVGGDVAYSDTLETVFYEELTRLWCSQADMEAIAESEPCRCVIAILGNHELWDGDPLGGHPSRPVEEIVSSYRSALEHTGVILLENNLYVRFKTNGNERSLNERAILDADPEELADLCNKSTFLVLGGIGYSGLNPKFNASTGLYRNAVTLEDDISRAGRFKSVYDKVLSCAASRPVIVLTHTQAPDWSADDYNPNWVYVNGHTHVNTLVRKDDGTTVLSDNQVGYEPKQWRLNCFTHLGTYDPLAGEPDGIKVIKREQYRDFNHGQGISMSDFSRQGDILMVKRDGLYLFLLVYKKLYLLSGGRITNAEHEPQYYYDNMPLYRERVEAAFRPYRNALNLLSREVRSFGGYGDVHGCIVDIDFFNHIYLNPFDGQVTPYYAESTASWKVYKDIPTLLASSTSQYDSSDYGLKGEYQRALSRGDVPTLSKCSNDPGLTLASIPQTVLDTSGAYQPSRIMRSVQYALDQNVIRIWNDDVLNIEPPLPPHSAAALPSKGQ